MTLHEASAGSIHEIMTITHALRAANLTDAEARGISEVPGMADAMVQAGRRFYTNHLRQSEPSEGLDTPIEQLKLSKGKPKQHHIHGVMVYYGIRVVGDLAQLRELDLTDQSYIGTHCVQVIKDGAARYGVTLFEPGNDPLEQAITVAGSASAVRARLMRLWQEGIDRYTQHYLRDITLGDLSKMSREAFVANRKQSHNALRKDIEGLTDAPQAAIVAYGLATAGLSFAGE